MGRHTLLLAALAGALGAAQLLPPPKDGDIRVVYWELRDQTEIFLTILPRGSGQGARPSGGGLTFSWFGRGRTPSEPVNDATPIEVKAGAGMMWAPQAELWVEIDGRRVNLAGAMATIVSGAGPDYLPGTTTVGVLAQIAAAQRVTGDALGVRFALTDDQRAACGRFVARLRGGAESSTTPPSTVTPPQQPMTTHKARLNVATREIGQCL